MFVHFEDSFSLGFYAYVHEDAVLGIEYFAEAFEEKHVGV